MQIDNFCYAMGNSSSSPPGQSKALDGCILQQYEHKNGKKLIAAIKLNSALRTRQAIEEARVEFIRPTKKTSNEAEYDEMINGMIKYLTQGYNVGDGILFTKSPIQYGEYCKADEALEVVKSELEKYQQMLQRNENVTEKPRDRISSDRAKLAKERLKNFQETRNK